MRFVLVLIAVAGLLVPPVTFALGESASHVYEPDDLMGVDDYRIEGSATRYFPDLPSTPVGVVVDEVYLRIQFKTGEIPGIDRLIEVRCAGCLPGGADFFTESGQFKYQVEGQDLILAYGFADGFQNPHGFANADEEVEFATTSNWSFLVSGSLPVQQVEFYMAYHDPGHVAMPDLYAADSEQTMLGENKLLVPDTNEDGLLNPIDWSVSEPITGSPPSGEKLIVLIHGWNPDSHLNHYGIPDDSNDPLDYKWINLFNNLAENSAVQKTGWQVAMYDWAVDADTGDIFVNEPISISQDPANRARDAGHAHGLKLGRLLANINNLKEVHFIAHSAGNWAARRAAEYLKNRSYYYNDVPPRIQITSLDPFVNDDDPELGDRDIDLQPDFELMRQWIDYLDNFYTVDLLTDNVLYWTSGNFLGWDRNVNIETLGTDGLYEGFMDDHSGPVYWYALTSVASVDLTVTANPDPVMPGERIIYTFAITNPGPGVIQGLILEAITPEFTSVPESLSQPMATCIVPGVNYSTCPSGALVRWRLDRLLPGGSQLVVMQATVGSVPDGTIISGLARVYYHGWGEYSTTDVIVDSDPNLRLEIDANPGPVGPSEQLVYTLSFGNRSGIDAWGTNFWAKVPVGTDFISASDGGTLIGDTVHWDLDTVEAGVFGKRTFNVAVAAGTMDGEVVVSKANIQDALGAEVDARASAVTAVRSEMPVSLEMTANPDPVRPGERIYYTFTITNHGDQLIEDLVLENHTPANTNVSESLTQPRGYCIYDGVNYSTCPQGVLVRWVLDPLLPGESHVVVMQATVNSVPDGTLISNRATVRYLGAPALLVAERAVAVEAEPRLRVEIDANPGPVGAGELLIYTLSFGNRSAIDAWNTHLRARVPVSAIFVSSSDGGTLIGDTVHWDLGTVQAGAFGQRTFTVAVATDAVDGDVIVSEAEIQDVLGTEVDARANAATAVRSEMPVSLEMTANPDPVRPGERIHYTFTITNHSAQLVEELVLEDQTPVSTVVPVNLAVPSASCVVPGVLDLTCDPGELLRWRLDPLLPGESFTVLMQATVGSVPDGSLISNRATVRYRGAPALIIAERTVAVGIPPAGITVSPTLGLTTTESGGQASFTIVLDSVPTDDVSIALDSSDITEGMVLPESVVFSTLDWATPKTVTVTGVDDSIVDGDIAYAVITAPALSLDSRYSGLNAPDVSLVNQDNDVSSSNCSEDFVVVQNVTYAAGEVVVCTAGVSLTTHSFVTVDTGADVTYVSPVVALNSGFSVGVGGAFRVQPALLTQTTELASSPASTSVSKSLGIGRDPADATAGPHRLRFDELPLTLRALLEGAERVSDMFSDATRQYIVFATDASLLEQDTNSAMDVYWYDSGEHVLVLVSTALTGAAGNGSSLRPRMDGRGEVIVFQSDASNLVLGDTNHASDIFITDTYQWLTERISQTPGGWESESASEHPALDAAGEQILYDRLDADGFRQIYGYAPDRLSTDILSLQDDERGNRLDNHHPGISPDGRYLMYLETIPATYSEFGRCSIHVFEQPTENFVRLPCPEGLRTDGEFVLFFSDDSSRIEWLSDETTHVFESKSNSNLPTRLVVENPFVSPR